MKKSRGFPEVIEKYSPMVATPLFELAKKIPFARTIIERHIDGLLANVSLSRPPYLDAVPSYRTIPKTGRETAAVLKEMKAVCEEETARWRQGYVSGAVYHGDGAHIDFLNRVYSLHSQSNPLHSDLWPSAMKYEAEVISMTAEMLNAKAARYEDGSQADVCGTITSGGTESILLAMKTYRDFSRSTRGIHRPEIVAPVTAHAAFDKASEYFGIKIRKVPVGPDGRAVVREAQKAITKNTIAIVGSAPSFPHGIIDPIEELSELARSRAIGFHTDACLGGFILPWAQKLGYPVEPFDFRVPGVTSISADTHKYGYANKGTSVILYRNRRLRRFQYYTATDWPGGLYFSPTFAGSRPGALSAVCWAALVTMGEQGYIQATKRILETSARIKQGIRSIPELRLIGDPLWVLAFGSDTVDMYQVMDRMSERGWNLNGLHKPTCVHLCVTLRHTQDGVADRFIEDLRASVEAVMTNPPVRNGLAPMYGLAAAIPARTAIRDVLHAFIDRIYEA